MFTKVEDTPMNNFNLLFEYLNHDYSYKDEHAFTMDELKARYLNEMQSNPTEEQFAEIFIKIEHDLSDPHFQSPYNAYTLLKEQAIFSTSTDEASEVDNIVPEFKGAEINMINNNGNLPYGIVKKDPTIGYIYVEGLIIVLGGSERLKGNKWKAGIELIIKDLKDKGVTRMIVDVRSGAGGSNYNALYIANRFANTTSPYMIERYEADNGKFDEITYSVKPEGQYHFRDGKIALLSNTFTCSGGEMFVLAMLQRKNLVHIGTPSEGCSGAIIQRDFYNGWDCILTSSQTTLPDGTTYFKTGIRPQIIVKNTREYYKTHKDKVLERAIVELNK
jgi:hypothetical protein